MTTPNRRCAHCASPLPAGARFCESCGAPADPSSAIPDPATPAPDCPKCGKSDQCFTAQQFCAKEVSDAEEKAADTADKWGPTYAQIVMEKPEPPRPPNLGGWLVVPFVPLVNFLACWFAPMHRAYKFFMLGIVTVFWVCVFAPEVRDTAAYSFVGCFFILFYYAALFIDRDRQKAEYFTKLLPEYHRALPRWERLRYCQRCEAVWLDGEPGRCVSVDKTPEILKSAD